VKRRNQALLLLIPTFAFTATFIYGPFLLAFYNAFFSWEEGEYRIFVGLGNFRHLLFEDYLFWHSMKIMAILSVTYIAKVMIVPMLAAVLISRVGNARLRGAYRNLIVIALIVPSVAVYMIWRQIYHPDGELGLANRLFALFGLEPIAWFRDPDTALLTIILTGFPWASGVQMLIYLAGLQNISQDVKEAATIDGVGPLQRFFRMELPLIVGQVRLIAILSVISSVQDFVGVYLLTRGGPAGTTYVPGLLMFDYAIKYNQIGMGCALGVILFLIVLTLTLFIHRFVRTEDYL